MSLKESFHFEGAGTKRVKAGSGHYSSKKRGVCSVCVGEGEGVTLWAEISSFQVSLAPGS